MNRSAHHTKKPFATGKIFATIKELPNYATNLSLTKKRQLSIIAKKRGRPLNLNLILSR